MGVSRIYQFLSKTKISPTDISFFCISLIFIYFFYSIVHVYLKQQWTQSAYSVQCMEPYCPDSTASVDHSDPTNSRLLLFFDVYKYQHNKANEKDPVTSVNNWGSTNHLVADVGWIFWYRHDLACDFHIDGLRVPFLWISLSCLAPPSCRRRTRWRQKQVRHLADGHRDLSSHFHFKNSMCLDCQYWYNRCIHTLSALLFYF